MTDEEKDILIAKMLDPDSFLTDGELTAISLDEELKDILAVSSAVRSAGMPKPELDVEQEWELFRHRILPKPSSWRWVMRVAAIFLGVLVVSAIVRMSVDYIFSTDRHAVVVEATVQKPVVSSEPLTDHTNESVVEDNSVAEVETITTTANIQSPGVSRRNLECEKEIDVDEYIRRQQADIDADITRIQAEMIVDQATALGLDLDYSAGLPPLSESDVKYLTIP